MPARAATCLDHPRGPLGHHLGGREDQGRVQVALDAAVADQLDPALQRGTPVDPHHVDPRLAHQREQVGGRRPRSGCAARPSVAGRRQHPGRVRHHVLAVVVGGQRAGPGVEELDGRGAGVHLHLQVRRGDVGDLAHQRVPHLGGAEHHRLGLRVLLRRTALDQVGGHRERRPGEADQRGGAELADQTLHRLGDERHVLGRQVRDRLHVGQGRAPARRPPGRCRA